jgi:hypothetical protein
MAAGAVLETIRQGLYYVAAVRIDSLATVHPSRDMGCGWRGLAPRKATPI